MIEVKENCEMPTLEVRNANEKAPTPVWLMGHKAFGEISPGQFKRFMFMGRLKVNGEVIDSMFDLRELGEHIVELAMPNEAVKTFKAVVLD